MGEGSSFKLVSQATDCNSTIFCRLCGWPVVATLLNDFLDHLASSHSLRIYSVLLGERTLIRTDQGDVEVTRQDTMVRA